MKKLNYSNLQQNKVFKDKEIEIKLGEDVYEVVVKQRFTEEEHQKFLIVSHNLYDQLLSNLSEEIELKEQTVAEVLLLIAILETFTDIEFPLDLKDKLQFFTLLTEVLEPIVSAIPRRIIEEVHAVMEVVASLKEVDINEGSGELSKETKEEN